jgi:serine/threonine-protein kinase
MASVWLARFGGRLGFERMVVIKMILPQFSQDPRFQEMFLDEARIASKIEHSNVARILDVGEHQDNYFIVMEWVDGDSLSKVLRASEQRKQRMPAGIAMRIIADAAAGLHAAHELKERDGTPLGVVHRDVSPQNILIANSGATMIIDFGVAKARDRVSQDTSAGQLKGKIRYMAPEQALGRSIDHRADVWALGAMLYEMFTGNPPYDGPNEVATLHKLTSGQRPPAMPRTMPEVLRAVVDRALGYEPEERFPSALELNLALEGAMVEISEPTTPAIVAHYTAQLLADRKAARKKAVDNALDIARKREAGQPVPSGALPIGPPSTGVLPTPPLPSSARVLAPIIHHEAPSATSAPSGPSAAGGSGPISLNEVPSATSSATLGSANMEYLPERLGTMDEVPRRRRYLAAAALGVSVAAGVIGAVLIISSAVIKHDDKPSASSAPPAAAGDVPSATETIELPSTPTADTAAAAATTAAAPAPTPTTTATPSTSAAPAAPTTSTPVTHNDPPPSRPPPGGAHKPPPPPPPVKPPPVKPPAPTSTKVDRGF